MSFGQLTRTDVDTSSTLEAVYNFRPGAFNPITILKVSNELSSFSKEQIIDTIRTTYSSSQGISSGYGLFLLLQLTFDIPDSLEYPELIWGIPDVTKPDSAAHKNRFPLLMVEGFPILIPGGYILNGLPDNLERHLQFYTEYGIVRTSKHELHCNCDLPQITASMRNDWEQFFNEEMDTYEEKRYNIQLELIVDHSN